MSTKIKYSLKDQNGQSRIHLEGDIRQASDLLVKYYSINERNVAALLDSKFYVSTSDQLNDLFDTLFFAIRPEIGDKEIYKLLAKNVQLEFDDNKFITDEKYRIKFRNSIFAIWNSKVGIFSVTDKVDNDLMWSHYTSNEGFAIRFNWKTLPSNFGEPVPINYLKPEEFKEYNYPDLGLRLFVNALIKKKDWDYENEFRFLAYPNKPSFETGGTFSNAHHDYPKESRLIKYSTEIIDQIVLGFDFFRNSQIKSDGNQIDFSRQNEILKKNIIDFAISKKIPISLIHLDHQKMKLIPFETEIEQISEMKYSLKVNLNKS